MWIKLALASLTVVVNIWMIIYFSDNNPAPILPANPAVLEYENSGINTNIGAQNELVSYECFYRPR